MKVDYWMQYYDVIANPRWRTTASIEYLSKNESIMMEFGTLNHIVTMITRGPAVAEGLRVSGTLH